MVVWVLKSDEHTLSTVDHLFTPWAWRQLENLVMAAVLQGTWSLLYIYLFHVFRIKYKTLEFWRIWYVQLLKPRLKPSTLTESCGVRQPNSESLCLRPENPAFFPTSLCEVIGFGCAPPSASFLPSARLLSTHNLPHTTYSHNLLTHNLPTHNLHTHTHLLRIAFRIVDVECISHANQNRTPGQKLSWK